MILRRCCLCCECVPARCGSPISKPVRAIIRAYRGPALAGSPAAVRPSICATSPSEIGISAIFVFTDCLRLHLERSDPVGADVNGLGGDVARLDLEIVDNRAAIRVRPVEHEQIRGIHCGHTQVGVSPFAPLLLESGAIEPDHLDDRQKLVRQISRSEHDDVDRIGSRRPPSRSRPPLSRRSG